MNNRIKQLLKQVFHYLPFTITKNQRYDRLARHVIKRVCRPDSCCVDVGCHKGEMLDLMLKTAPNGFHYGFEPLPHLHQYLEHKYRDRPCHLFDIALSNDSGTTSFNYVVSNPSYSGLQKRHYDRPGETDQLIEVRKARLDDLIPSDVTIDFIKIDVEGGELQVLEGAIRILISSKPVVIFEHGLGAAECYQTTPLRVYDFFQALGYQIFLLDAFLHQRLPLNRAAFERQFYGGLNYYFVACNVQHAAPEGHPVSFRYQVQHAS